MFATPKGIPGTIIHHVPKAEESPKKAHSLIIQHKKSLHQFYHMNSERATSASSFEKAVSFNGSHRPEWGLEKKKNNGI
jgi:hypothetical protein